MVGTAVEAKRRAKRRLVAAAAEVAAVLLLAAKRRHWPRIEAKARGREPEGKDATSGVAPTRAHGRHLAREKRLRAGAVQESEEASTGAPVVMMKARDRGRPLAEAGEAPEMAVVVMGRLRTGGGGGLQCVGAGWEGGEA